MSYARVANRMPRYRKPNPGTKHLYGRDVTSKMQRQYKDILESLRSYKRYSSDAKRKQVAAATVRKIARNPDEYAAAVRLAEEFHGRTATGDYEVEEHDHFDEYGAVLGYLLELRILDEDGYHDTDIGFAYDLDKPEENILLVSNPAGTNIEFVGGDQSIDWWNVEGASRDTGKNYVMVGPVHQISYWADKYHLGGSKAQQQDMEYYHSFGEDPDGDLPWLIYQTMNDRMLLVGGDYVVKPEGITG